MQNAECRMQNPVTEAKVSEWPAKYAKRREELFGAKENSDSDFFSVISRV
jgi:hypothetical protein